MPSFKSILAGASLVALAVPSLAGPMDMDKPVTMGPLTLACTGVGSAKDDPQWQEWPVRIVFSNGAAQFLSGAHVVIGQGTKTLADVDCAGPWVLVKGPAGNYHVTATIDNSTANPADASFAIGGNGQKRVELQFPSMKPNQ
ncbi:MAG TPA: hypothetical protein VGU69_16000 [Rhizomicrobium sp.]|nr:hypothetical protein [Rhizomicrobium sp.]